jgi:CheY-like chemotaxis protein
MSTKGPIVIIENDPEDQELIRSAFNGLQLRNELLFFSYGEDAFNYLLDTKDNPFLILAELKMPRVDGLELCARINKHPRLKKKSIPYILLTEFADKKDVDRAYSLCVQGFFIKPNSLEEFQEILRIITSYWMQSVEPNQLTMQI